MEHLRVACYLLALLCGTAALGYAIVMRRTYRLPFLGPFAMALGCQNVLLLVNLASAYVCANVIGFCTTSPRPILIRFLSPVALLSIAGIAAAMAGVARGFLGRGPARGGTLRFGVAAGFVAAADVMRLIEPVGTPIRRAFENGRVAASLLGLAAIVAILVLLVRDSRRMEGSAERRAAGAFGAAFAALYAVFLATFFLPVETGFFPNVAAQLGLGLFPFVWFTKFFPAAFAAPDAVEDRDEFARFCRQRGLTSREAEVLGLILRGRSNAAIEKELFISIHTVKNHVTSINSKLRVRGRWQMIALFRGERRRIPAAGEAVPQGVKTN